MVRGQEETQRLLWCHEVHGREISKMEEMVYQVEVFRETEYDEP